MTEEEFQGQVEVELRMVEAAERLSRSLWEPFWKQVEELEGMIDDAR